MRISYITKVAYTDGHGSEILQRQHKVCILQITSIHHSMAFMDTCIFSPHDERRALESSIK